MIDRKKLVEGLEYCIKAKDKNCPMACPFFKECFSVFTSTEPFYPVMRAVLEFLKEQEPVMLENQHKPYGNSLNANAPWISRCPKCGKKVEGKQTRYCKYCGQVVKWDD